MRLGAITCALVLALAATAAAQAVETGAAPPPVPTEIRAHLDRGEQLFEAGGFDAALAEYQVAYEGLAGHPLQFVVEFNIAQCHERLSQYDLALEHYQRYLDQGGASEPDAAAVRGRIDVLSGLLGTIVVTLEWPDVVATEGRPEVEVWVGERRIGTAPGEIRVPGGNHAVEVRAAGFEPRIESVLLAAGGRVSVAFSMSPVSTGRGLDPAVFWGASTATILAALVGGSIGVTVVIDAARASMPEPGDATFTTGDVQSIQDRSLVADIFYGTAGLFAVTAIILYFASDWSGAPPPSDASASPATTVRAAPLLGPTTAGLAFEGSF